MGRWHDVQDARLPAAPREEKRILLSYTQRATAKASRRDWVFLVETSADRDPLLARAQIEILRHLLQHAGPDDRFAVLTAGTRVRAWANEPRPATPENIAAALDFLESAHLIGALRSKLPRRIDVTPAEKRGSSASVDSSLK